MHIAICEGGMWGQIYFWLCNKTKICISKRALYTNIQFVYFQQTILEDDDYKDLMSSDDSDESDEEAKGR